MASAGATPVERLFARVFLPLAAVAGAIVLSGFFFPEFVGEAVSGQSWLAVSLVFFIAGMGYLAVLPYHPDREEASGDSYLLRIRRTGLLQSLRSFASQQDLVVFGVPVTIFAAFFLLQVLFPAATTSAVDGLAGGILDLGGPVFLGAMFVAVLYCAYLLLGPWGDIRLGGEDETPSYTYPTYFTLIFTAGIAAGIVVWGPAEALFHFETPPPYFGGAPESAGAMKGALTYALFHWGFSAWSAYTVIGVPIAYYVYTRGAPLRVSTILAPFLGVDGLDSGWSRLVDTLAVVATIGGIATSVALVAQQFLIGINFQWGVATGQLGPVLFVGGLMLLVVLSAVTGIHRGIRRIAGLNIVLFGVFALLIVAVGPRGFVLDQSIAALGSYAVNFVPLSLFSGGEWVSAWTVWNWSWWFSWAPFAGLFIAALSRGRRIRTVVLTSVVATSAASIVWFLLLGGTSLFVQSTGQADILGAIAARGGEAAVAGFPLFAALPVGQLLMFLFLALIVVFITTSADTSTLVVALLATQRGLAPSTSNIAFWGAFQGGVAVVVLLVGGAETLQALAVLTGGPFAVLSLVALAGLTLTFSRHEGGHTSLVGRVRDRLPAIQTHHDIEPPDD